MTPRRTGPVSFRGAEVSCPNILSIACPKIKCFCRNIHDFLPEYGYLKNSTGEAGGGGGGSCSPPPPPASYAYGMIIHKTALCFLCSRRWAKRCWYPPRLQPLDAKQTSDSRTMQFHISQDLLIVQRCINLFPILFFIKRAIIIIMF